MAKRNRAWELNFRSYNTKDIQGTLGALLGMASEHARVMRQFPRLREVEAQHMATQDIARRMTIRGLSVVQSERTALQRLVKTRLTKATRAFQAVAGDILPTQTERVAKLLYETLGAEPPHYTKGSEQLKVDGVVLLSEHPDWVGPRGEEVGGSEESIEESSEERPQGSTDAAALAVLVDDQNPTVRAVAEALLRCRAQQKLLSTYITPLLGKLRVHPSWRNTGAVTGRWSCSSPNLMNQPDEMRIMYSARPGYVLVSRDYSQLEMRETAYFTSCAWLLGALNEKDAHTKLACELYGIGASELTKDRRDLWKCYWYARTYGAGVDKRLSMIQNFQHDDGTYPFKSITRQEIMAFDARLAKFAPELEVWNRRLFAQVEKDGFYESTLSGRVHWFNNGMDYTRVVNNPNQEGAAAVINAAMVRLDGRLRKTFPKDFKDDLQTPFVLQIHDELVAEAPERNAERYSLIMKEEMEREVVVAGRRVVFPTDVKINESWAKV